MENLEKSSSFDEKRVDNKSDKHENFEEFDIAAQNFLKRFEESVDDKEKAEELGEYMYEKFSDDKFDLKSVLDGVVEIYVEMKDELKGKVAGFDEFLLNFGDKMVSLVQLKLVKAGFDLGKFGENKDGVDGKFGRVTKKAMHDFLRKNLGENYSKLIRGKNEKISSVGEVDKHDHDGHGHSHESKGEHISSKAELVKKIDEIYARREVHFDLNNVFTSFGAPDNRVVANNERFIQKEIIKDDPLTGKRVSFLGKPLNGGINRHCYVFLKIAEEKIRARGVNYQPVAKEVGGYCFREMKMQNKQRSFVPSFHAAGLAIDIDASANGPKDGRGNIPVVVVLALVESGFTSGLRGREKSKYLGTDPMHFQLDDFATSETMLKIVRESEVGKRYFKALFGDVDLGGNA